MHAAILQDLCLYPLKSARGIRMERVRLGPTGFEWDRHWMVTRPDGVFLTQRSHPTLARIAVSLTPRGLRLQCDGHDALELPFDAPDHPCEVRIWKDVCAGFDQGDAAAAWVTAVLGEPARLVRAPASPARHADMRYAGALPAPLAFPDGYPLLICNQASLDALNERLGAPLPMERFRPNLVLAGLEPFAEDRIGTLHIGPVRLRLVKPCTRCIIPSRDQRTGLADIDPLPVLRTFRFDPRLRGVTFGVNAVIDTTPGEWVERGASCGVEYVC